MDSPPYAYSAIVDREPIRWPGGARVAFYVGLNVEHFELGPASTSLIDSTAGLVPDALNHGWRDYGNRVGIWRLTDTLDRYGVRASALVNSDVVHHYPRIVDAGRERGWAWVAHGRTNSRMHTGLDEAAERAELAHVVDTIERGTGTRPHGWMGPALTETERTPALLAELGLGYVLDWTADDQPFGLTVPGMLSVPYTVELGDIGVFLLRGQTGEQFRRMVIDQFDQLYADSARSGRVMALALHPFVIGQPARHRYLAEALEYVTGHDGVWVTTSDEIAEHYTRHHGDAISLGRPGVRG